MPAARKGREPPQYLTEVVGDKGYHSNHTVDTLKEGNIRSYLSEPDRGRRRWKGRKKTQAAVYANSRRIRGVRGKALQRRRSEYVERSFAHLYETGGMRRVYLRGHEKILKRLLIHGGAFNLGLAMRKLTGTGTPRGFHGLSAAIQALAAFLKRALERLGGTGQAILRAMIGKHPFHTGSSCFPGSYHVILE